MVREDYIKTVGRYNIQKGEKVKGVISGVAAAITGVKKIDPSLLLIIHLIKVLDGKMMLVS